MENLGVLVKYGSKSCKILLILKYKKKYNTTGERILFFFDLKKNNCDRVEKRRVFLFILDKFFKFGIL